MAWLQERAGSWRLVFRYDGRQQTCLIGPVGEQEALAVKGKVEYLLLRVKQGLIAVPPGVTITDFVLADGKVAAPEIAAARAGAPAKLTYGQLRDQYLEARSGGSLEANSLATVAMHLRHLGRTLGDGFPVRELTLADLQRHVKARAASKFRGRALSAYTIRKEVGTFRAAWNWGSLHGLVGGNFPSKGLLYPKLDEKPPFLTWEELEREAKGLPEAERLAAWERLYLRREEVAALLAHVKEKAAHPWVYPMFCAAAHTGMRRSELIRAELADLKLDTGLLLVREKKRSRQKRTTRHVSLSPFLKAVLAEWAAAHPGGKYLFCWSGVVARSTKRSATTGHQGERRREKTARGRKRTVRAREAAAMAAVTKDEAHDHLRRTLSGSKWEVLHGWHTLRHSFCSNLAAAGVDQRVIDELMGHQSDEQRRRYRHLVPDLKHRAVAEVFG